MKKLTALLLAAVMLLGCVSAFAEETAAAPLIEKNTEGNYEVSFQVPEGFEVAYSKGEEDSYAATLRSTDGLVLGLSVVRFATDAQSDKELGTATYNEENGYTDEYLKEMAADLYGDTFDDYEVAVKATAYGTKLIIARFNDPESPYAYMHTVWNNYEIGLTVANVDADGKYNPVTDEQIDTSVAFISELWMAEKTAK